MLSEEDLKQIREIIKEEIAEQIKELTKDVRGPDGCFTFDGHGHTMLGSQWICER